MATDPAYQGGGHQHSGAYPPPPPPGPMYGGAGGGYGGYGYGGGWGPPRRAMYPIETKPFFLTSEFLVLVLTIVALSIGVATAEDFDSYRFWPLVAGVTSAYMLSRGIAKSGSKSRGWDPRDDLMARAGAGGDDRD